MWPACEDCLQRQFKSFLSNGNAISCILLDYFRAATFYEKLFLHSKHFCRAATSPK